MTGPDLERKARRAAARAARRLRYRAALARLALWLPLPLGVGTISLAVLKFAGWGGGAERLLVGLSAVSALVALGVPLRALLRRPPRWSGALALDQHHQLGDRLTTALALLDGPEAGRTGLSALAIEDGLARASSLDPRRAVPIPIPRELAVSLLLGASLVAAAWFEVRVVRVLPPPPSFTPLVMTGDDLDLFSDMARRLAEKAEDPDSLAAIRRFNALIEDIAGRRLERQEAFQRMSELEAELAKSADIDREARELGLEGLARELGKSGLAKSAAQALQEKRLSDAEKALRDLADRLKRKDRPVSRAELERLRGAAASASRVSSERLQAIEERRRELAEEKQSLLKRKKPENAAEASKLEAQREENRRKLERLERDQERASRAARELSDLDRELAKAAEDLQRDQQSGAEDIRRTAEELAKVKKRELSEKEKRELLERLREMKELVRQQGQGGQERMRQMARFGQRARGGKSGEGQDQQGGAGKRPGRGGPGGSELVEVPRLVRERVAGSGSQGSNASPSEAKPSANGKAGPEGSGSQAGKEWGRGHDENLAGDPTKAQGETHDVTAAAVDTGQGTASAETIRGAAERGFVGKAYRDIFVDYQTVAEQSLEHDQIPPGYRFYVRRYFQLIRPRE
jgi:hypothetical protein